MNLPKPLEPSLDIVTWLIDRIDDESYWEGRRADWGGGW